MPARSARSAARPARGTVSTADELALRRTPRQARGRATFDRILDSTARLLEDTGAEGLTTNLIAKSAAVNVATLYQYFPNKQSVLLELFKRQTDARIQAGRRHIVGASGTADWRRNLRSAVRAIASAHASLPGAMSLRQVMRSSPDLLQHERLYSRQVADALAAELRVAGVPVARARLVARCAIEALSALLDLWSIETRGRDRRIVDEAESLLLVYLAPSLGGTVRSRGARAKRGG